MVKAEKHYKFVVCDVSRHGQARLYFKKSGFKKIRLRGPSGSDQFEADYAAAVSATEKHGPAIATTVEPPGAKPETFRWLCEEYFKSAEFKQLDERNTQHVRRLILESIWKEETEPGSKVFMGDCPLLNFNRKAVVMLRDRKLKFPAAANNRLKVMRGVFKWALDNEVVEFNPCVGVKDLETGNEGFHSWTDSEAEQYEKRWAIGTPERLAFALLRYLGVRRSDVVRLGRQHLQDEGRTIKFRVFKGRRRNPTTLELPVLPELQAIIDASPTGDLAFLVTGKGLPFTDAGFGNWFREKCDKADLPQCSAHGLRKLAATSFAYAGATPHQLMAWFGWKSIKQAEVYTRAAEQKRLANSLVGRGNA
jgi:integrase